MLDLILWIFIISTSVNVVLVGFVMLVSLVRSFIESRSSKNKWASVYLNTPTYKKGKAKTDPKDIKQCEK